METLVAPDKELTSLKWISFSETSCVFNAHVYHETEVAVVRHKQKLVAPCCYLQGWRYFLTSLPPLTSSRPFQSAPKPDAITSSEMAQNARKSLWAQLKAPVSIRKEAAAIITRIRTHVQYMYAHSDEHRKFFSSAHLTALFSPLWSPTNNYTLEPLDDHFVLRPPLGNRSRGNNRKRDSVPVQEVALVGVHMRLTDYYASHTNIVADGPFFLAAAAHLISRFTYVEIYLKDFN